MASKIIMPRRKTKYTRDELEERLDIEFPGITDKIPSPKIFKFWTDNTPKHNEYVEVGSSFSGAMRVGFGDKTGNKMLFYNIGARFPEKIMHDNKELARVETEYSAPFNCLSALRYEYPGSSSAESLQWFTELRALTMFAFVWCGRREKFFDFNKGTGLGVLVEVLKRSPTVDTTKAEEVQNDNKEDDAGEEDLAINTDADAGTHTGGEGDAQTYHRYTQGNTFVAKMPANEGNRPDLTITPMRPILNKRTYEAFVEGQQN
ncbi:hypothetical protein SLS60_009326 [Paraconiothyrium brasiliense]|uniref:Uncharacterized protein n=1 Tax=Paraconiothyrium brasiliense TaxID=300254 RepID=A0ABR3QWY3_9PLEO